MRRDPDHPFEEGEEAPPPGVRAMALVRWLLLAAVVLAALFSVYTYAAPLLGGEPPAARSGVRYICPMHPQIVSDRPGECPICHMTLVQAPEVTPSPSSPAPAATFPVPDPKATSAPPDTAPITLTLDRVQAIGVRTARVEKQNGGDGLRLTAAVEVPEQGRAEVHVRAPGYVEAIRVKDVGVKVKAGEVLVSVYSPEVFQAQQELLAMGTWSGAGQPQPPTAAARKKLELLGVGKETIDGIVASGQPVRAMGISSPIAGYVTRKDVVLGSYAMPDKALFEVADLDRVYLVASLYPHQLAVVRAGDEATFTTPSLPGHVFSTKVDLVYPEMDLATRTARVRFRVENKDLDLRPGQFGIVEIAGRRASALTVPMDAVIDTGRSVYVFIAGEGGRFEARSVDLGEQIGDRLVVRAGLAEGERVVSGATFLIDAESRIQASLVESAGPRPRPEIGRP